MRDLKGGTAKMVEQGVASCNKLLPGCQETKQNIHI